MKEKNFLTDSAEKISINLTDFKKEAKKGCFVLNFEVGFQKQKLKGLVLVLEVMGLFECVLALFSRFYPLGVSLVGFLLCVGCRRF
ncbi:hypothetical protein ID0498_15600 [Helicobacter pylori]